MRLQGADELRRALRELSNTDTSQWKSALRAGVRTPMAKVMKTAKANMASFSPGKTELHRTYTGRLVALGFSSRNIRLITKIAKDKTSISAILGVRKEAFYAFFFELGSSKTPRKPWLVPAFESHKDTAIRDIGAAIKKRLDAIAKRAAAQSRRAAA